MYFYEALVTFLLLEHCLALRSNDLILCFCEPARRLCGSSPFLGILFPDRERVLWFLRLVELLGSPGRCKEVGGLPIITPSSLHLEATCTVADTYSGLTPCLAACSEPLCFIDPDCHSGALLTDKRGPALQPRPRPHSLPVSEWASHEAA